MNFKKIITLLLAFTLTLSLAACGSKGDGKGDGDAQGATAEEIYAQIQELADKENAIMEENLELWQKLFAAMNEKRDEIPDESNYGAYLLAALDLVKDQFTEDELKTLTEGSEQIRDLEDQIQPLQEQYAALQPAGDGENGDMSAAVPTFPTFTGKDLDGNDVDSSIFSQNAVTVVNFWFSGCKPCVAELGDLNALNETLKKQGGALIGINVDTLDGNADAISTAKSLLESKGASYQNIYFPSDSAAGDFAGDIMAFPTTYVIDRSGAIVGEAMLGGIDSYLLAALDLVKDKFTEDELKTLTEGSEKIRDLEDQIQPLQEQYAALQPAGDGENGGMNDSVPAFPAFTGKDLDGNDVDNSIFSQNAVTVVNFWFSGCKPCVAELGELNALNETLKKQGGAVVGINVDTLDGNADAISTAKNLLESKGASYQNIYFPSDSAAGDFAGDIMAFPTTYVIDRSGAIVGEAMLGGIDNEDNMAALQKLIDQALANDSAK